MLTIFSIPKPFKGHINIIQRNAIHSWSLLHPDCEIILCGNEPGTCEVVNEFNIKWLPDIECNEYGTPLLNSAFENVRKTASQDLLCYVNADIILLNDFMESLKRIHFKRFLAVGQRWDIDLSRKWNFHRTDWERRLHAFVADKGKLHALHGIDYFVFPKNGIAEKMPSFAVGRPGWDNWFIYHVRKSGFPVIDITRVITAIHQNHGYSHVPESVGKTWKGPEADRNMELMGGMDYFFSIGDATYILTSKLLLPALGYRYLGSRWLHLPVLFPATKGCTQLLDRLIVDRLRYYRRRLG